MENGLVIGFDLCTDCCRISSSVYGQEEPEDLAFSGDDNPYVIQNAICKKKGEEVWLVGEDAYQTALFGGGTIVNKLLKLVEVGGSATFERVTYSAEDLMTRFLNETLNLLCRSRGTTKIEAIMFTVQTLSATVLDVLLRAVKRLGIERDKVHFISHTESYLYFVLSQRRELWSNLSILYDLSGDGLNYYELEIMRGVQPNVAYAKRTFLEEGFSADILSSPSGCRMADAIMTKCVKRMLAGKLVSSCYLSGQAMESCQRWGSGFLEVLCERRRVFYSENLFAKGAVYAALDLLNGKSVYPFTILCEGRVNVDITLDVSHNGVQKTLDISKIGDNWYETKKVFDLIPDEEETLRFRIRKLNDRNYRYAEIPLKDFPKRPNKCTRLGVTLAFTSENTFTVTVRDKGFGEFYKAQDIVIRKDFTIE